ncbi:MAG: hypothetical protein WKF86_00185 [Acidimicrobiales bacterium]
MRVYTEWSEFVVKRDATVPTTRLYTEWLESALERTADIPTARLYTEWIEVAVKTAAPASGGWSVGAIRIA